MVAAITAATRRIDIDAGIDVDVGVRHQQRIGQRIDSAYRHRCRRCRRLTMALQRLMWVDMMMSLMMMMMVRMMNVLMMMMSVMMVTENMRLTWRLV